jgi:DNA processing protein
MKFEEYSCEGLLGPLNEVEKKNAPTKLHIAGDPTLLRRAPRVAIVGSRKASPEGLEQASALARSIVERGVVVVSGLAEGIDTAAHESAVRAGGKTVAVLGTPLDQCYPAKNRALQDLIMREHLAVSQFPPESPSRRENFPMRNRTMALLSDATVIVEAGDGSGSLHQGWEALRLGRPLFLMESVVKRPGLAWPSEMRRYGAEVLSLALLDVLFESLPQGSRDEASQLAF